MKVVSKVISVIMTMMLLLTYAACTTVSASAGTNKFNVVFVLDASGSMNSTDSSGLRYDAIDLFLNLLTEQGNHVGNVIFTQTVDRQLPIMEIKSAADKDTVLNDLKSIVPKSGDTNIGLAIAAATDMLDSGRNTSLDSIIVLLSDGNTDLDSQKGLEDAEYYKQYAITHARTGQYKIYCVGLNADGTMNAGELSDIAASTGGEFIEVRNPEDLSKVMESFYSIIYNTPSSSNQYTIPSNGQIEQGFTVPTIGVNEVNIVTRGNVSGVSLIRPDGTAYSQSELENIMNNGSTYNFLKIPQPVSGDWKVLISGAPGNQVTISMIPNMDVSVGITSDKNVDDYAVNSSAIITSAISTSSGEVNDSEPYNSNKAVLVTKNLKDGSEKRTDMTVSNNRYTANINFGEMASYESYVEMDFAGTKIKSDTLTFNVGNKPPVISQQVIEDRIVLIPFLGTSKTYDIAPYVTDDVDTSFNYAITASSFDEEDTEMNGSELTVSPSVGVDGEVTVAVSDSAGASSEIKFVFNVVSLAKWIIIGIIAAALIVFGIIAFIIVRTKNKKYYGKIMIKVYDERTGAMYNNQMHNPYSGKKPIRQLDFNAADVGLDGWFIPKGKSCIVYESKTPFFCKTSMDPTKPVKSIEISLGMFTTISPVEDYSCGADISYV